MKQPREPDVRPAGRRRRTWLPFVGVVVLVAIAVLVGFPIARTLIAAIHAALVPS